MTALFCFSSRRRHTRWPRDWSSDVCSSDLKVIPEEFDTGYKAVIQLRNTVVRDYSDLDHALLEKTITMHKEVIDEFRSEERRVGKECRSRSWRYQYKKKE